MRVPRRKNRAQRPGPVERDPIVHHFSRFPPSPALVSGFNSFSIRRSTPARYHSAACSSEATSAPANAAPLTSPRRLPSQRIRSPIRAPTKREAWSRQSRPTRLPGFKALRRRSRGSWRKNAEIRHLTAPARGRFPPTDALDALHQAKRGRSASAPRLDRARRGRSRRISRKTCHEPRFRRRGSNARSPARRAGLPGRAFCGAALRPSSWSPGPRRRRRACSSRAACTRAPWSGSPSGTRARSCRTARSGSGRSSRCAPACQP